LVESARESSEIAPLQPEQRLIPRVSIVDGGDPNMVGLSLS
jgi:hypothetical protein